MPLIAVALTAVHRCRWLHSSAQRAEWRGAPVAVKMLNASGASPQSSRSSELAAFQAELGILSRTQHANVVRCFGGCLTPPQVRGGGCSCS